MPSNILHSLLEVGFQIIYAITLFVALWRYSKYYDTPLRFLPILFLFTFLMELVGYLVKTNEGLALIFEDITDNSLIYNIYAIVSYIYYYFVFWSFTKDYRQRKSIFWGGIIFLTSCLINPFFQNFISISQTFSYLLGGCILLYVTLSYLHNFYLIPQKFAVKQNIIFWMSLGLSIFYLGYLPIKTLKFYYHLHQSDVSTTVINIHWVLIIITYTIFIMGFFQMKRSLRISTTQ